MSRITEHLGITKVAQPTNRTQGRTRISDILGMDKQASANGHSQQGAMKEVISDMFMEKGASDYYEDLAAISKTAEQMSAESKGNTAGIGTNQQVQDVNFKDDIPKTRTNQQMESLSDEWLASRMGNATIADGGNLEGDKNVASILNTYASSIPQRTPGAKYSTE